MTPPGHHANVMGSDTAAAGGVAPPPVPLSGPWPAMHTVDGTPWSPDGPQDYHGLHIARRRQGYEPIEWRQIRGPRDTVRVITHTCECLATLYELCALGGTYFIRRTIRGESRDEVHESPRLIPGRTGGLWFRLLHGHAR
jgi:hypothetical protein